MTNTINLENDFVSVPKMVVVIEQQTPEGTVKETMQGFEVVETAYDEETGVFTFKGKRPTNPRKFRWLRQTTVEMKPKANREEKIASLDLLTNDNS